MYIAHIYACFSQSKWTNQLLPPPATTTASVFLEVPQVMEFQAAFNGWGPTSVPGKVVVIWRCLKGSIYIFCNRWLKGCNLYLIWFRTLFYIKNSCLAILCDLFGMVSENVILLEVKLGDLQPRDQKVTATESPGGFCFCKCYIFGWPDSIAGDLVSFAMKMYEHTIKKGENMLYLLFFDHRKTTVQKYLDD